MTLPAPLSPFPVDDLTLDVLEHALGASYDVDEDGKHHRVGADMTVPELLDFLSGYDPTLAGPLLNEYDTPSPDVTVYDRPTYTRDDVIRALVAEVRRLRSQPPAAPA